MNCALWLNKKKIFSADEIPENLDIASLRGYFLGGSLVSWLRENGGADYADRLAEIPENAADLNERLLEIFGCRQFGRNAGKNAGKNAGDIPASVFNGGCASIPLCGYCGSFKPASFSFGSGGALGSFVFKLGSFRAGSGIHEWEWEWRLNRGSFTTSFVTSYKGFGSGGFHEWEWEWRRRKGSFTSSGSFGSFKPGSGALWAIPEKLYEFGNSGSFLSMAPGSFRMLSSDEYDMIMYATLKKCPLDRYGYGIHNI